MQIWIQQQDAAIQQERDPPFDEREMCQYERLRGAYARKPVESETDARVKKLMRLAVR